MGLRRIAQEIAIQMKERKLRFNVDNDLELEEVIAETCEYVDDTYRGGPVDKVEQYLTETMQNFPEHIEPIREYIQPITA